MGRWSWLVVTGLVACSGDDGTTSVTDSGPTTSCANPLDSTGTIPVDGTADAYYRTTIEFTLTSDEAGATIAVADGAGAAVAGATTMVDGRVVFTPTDPLVSGTSYTGTLTWSCGTATTSFTVGSTGAAVSDTLVGNTYALDLASGRFLEPAGVETLLSTFLDFSLDLGIAAQDATSITFIGALADNTGAQDMCTESIVFPVPADFSSNPFFSVESDELPVEVEGVQVTINDLVLSGAFTPDGSGIQGGVLSGSLDTRTLLDVLEMTGDNAVCDLLAGLLIDCEVCDDGSPTCLSVYVDNLSADLVPGLTLEEVTADEIEANLECVAASTPTP